MKEKMKNKIKNFFENEKENLILFSIFFVVLIFIFSISNQEITKDNEGDFLKKAIQKTQSVRFEKNILEKKEVILALQKKGCIEILIDDEVCNLEKKTCELKKIPEKISCKKWKLVHLKKPEKLRAVYYSSYAGNSQKKIDYLINLVKNTEVNAVVIDIKEVDGKVAFDMSDFNFGSIKPVTNNIIKNPKKLIEKLHQNGIYTIGRIVVFKDKILAEKRPDLAIKTMDKKNVWTDYKGKKYLDPNNKEVWDYQVNLARAIYSIGFDEINFDYIRFPSDGNMENMYYPFSEFEIKKDQNWGRAKIIDRFFNYLTSNLRKEFPEIQLSGDLFGYTALEDNDLKIGQILEDAILYFDRIAPMTYPSHYNQNFIGLNSADSHPYEVIKYTMKKINKKIERINREIEAAKKKNRRVKIRDNFYAEADIESLEKIKKDKVAIWLQGFSCTWCKNYIPYSGVQVQAQARAAKEEGYKNWYIWNAASRYRQNWFLEK